MKKITTLILMGATIAAGVGALTPRTVNAQLFYPPASDRNTLMVIGQGIVKVPADTADIELFISGDSIDNELEMQEFSLLANRTISSSHQKSTAPISYQASLISKNNLTQASLKPVVDSLVAKGIKADNIKVQISSDSRKNQAKMLVRLDKPTSDQVRDIIATANAATSKLENVSIEDVSVNYEVNDCQALQSSAYQSAMKDAQSRAQALATAMGVKLGGASVAEPFYSMFYPSCNSKGGLPLPSFGGLLSSPSGNADAPAEIEMKKDIFVTYTVQ
ncbi:SIMPL domain-containing protein [Nodularia sp. UHCC 0506]|uniref:SIMPL domain-containing protein n=1 Tax=Nodularia sp. UHCC 0506 TaxID=3110243 RepID=UPI002B219667|nr:SIMPL domain-containing protein [Nodularia sp. UHCC 0506]MEA5516005.1 SIMPL domain-containing protein [Nodularia sp. UHCC 0506]